MLASSKCTLVVTAEQPHTKMFDELISFTPEPGTVEDFVPLKKADTQKVLNAQTNTAQWLEELGVPSDEDIDTRTQTQAARNAFEALNYSVDTPAQITALAALKTPAAVQHLVGMLTAYDWEFISQAKELRGYTVAKILEETKHPDAKVRLKALQMLGNVTEIALFTERVEVTKKDASEEEIEKRLRERLSRFITPEDGAHIREITIDSEVTQVAEQRDA
jgi:hypothetical protein